MDDAEKELAVHNLSQRRKNSHVTEVRVTNIDPKHVDFDRFLFLRRPKEILQSNQVDIVRRDGYVIVQENLHALFIRGVFVCDYSGLDSVGFQDKERLIYSYNLKAIECHRDRGAGIRSIQLAKHIFRVWDSLLKESEDARGRYTSLLLNHENAIDVLGADKYADQGGKSLANLPVQS